MIVRARQRVGFYVAVGCLVAVVVGGFSAGRAAAIMVKLPSGGYANYDAMVGSKAPRPARIFDARFSNLDYSGGPVMPSSTNFTVVWQPSNYAAHTPFQTGYAAGVDQFFTDMAADSGNSTNSDAVATQYNDVNGHTAAYQFHNGGQLIDTDPLPSNGCFAFTGDICITDAQIQTELDSFLSRLGEPADFTHEYFLLTPPDVGSCFDAGSSVCSGNADLSQAYCAYHSQSASGYIYANIPDLTGLFGCDPFVTNSLDCPNFVCSYNNGPADGVLSAISHEHNESITDPQPNNAWTDWGGGVGGEDGDKCNNDGMADPSLNFGGANGDRPFNEVINGNDYLIQREWSNQGRRCRDAFAPNGNTALASFTAKPAAGGGGAVNFDASASTATGGVAEYVWQFNDGPGQTNTIETTQPTLSHQFTAPGAQYVALTVMTLDGTSNGTAQSVGGSPPTASFTSSGGAVEGTPVAFDASSTAPGPGTSVAGYTWKFGDGTTFKGSSPQTSHSYGHFGTYSVTVTATDADGLSNTSPPQSVTITDESPVAAFSTTPSSAAPGTPVAFDGTASSDPDGAVTGYSWSFGDGGTASGATASHAFGAAGIYGVTLQITDSNGQTAQVSHAVVITPAGAAAQQSPGSTVQQQGNCVVPNVKGKTASQATRALGAAHCRVGKITKPKRKPKNSAGRHKVWRLVVIGENPAAGAHGSNGAAVALKLAYRAVRTRH